jgi:hypothetical protein
MFNCKRKLSSKNLFELALLPRLQISKLLLCGFEIWILVETEGVVNDAH